MPLGACSAGEGLAACTWSRRFPNLQRGGEDRRTGQERPGLAAEVTKHALLALEDGSMFRGVSIGSEGASVGEVVFNTSMTGYQEILSDPSYCRQIVTLTCPHIGNVGANRDDEESDQVHAAGLVIREAPTAPSSWRAEEGLESYLERRSVVAIAGIDSRRLTRILREKGAQAGCIQAGESVDEASAVAAAREFPGLEGMDLAREVSTGDEYGFAEGEWEWDPEQARFVALPPPRPEFRVVAYDYGIKRNILRQLVARGCRVTVVPAETPASKVLTQEPDGVFLSNGPGDPEACLYAIEAIRVLLDTTVPIFGICLGHQLLAIAGGAHTRKMKFGHHGANHPVQVLATGEVLITSQNHGFAVDEESLPGNIQATHRSLFDASLQGIRFGDRPAFGFQGHPEASPGPHDIRSLFDCFVALMRDARIRRNAWDRSESSAAPEAGPSEGLV